MSPKEHCDVRLKLGHSSLPVAPPWRRNRGRRGGRPRPVLGCSMTEKSQILAALRAALPDLKRRWPIRSLAIFGSVARGNPGDKSDLDILVEFERPLGLSEFLALEDALSALVDRRVDLVTRDALKPHIDSRVLEDAVRL